MLAILTTHPIQYQVPLWQALAKDGSVPFEVWYLSDHAIRSSFDEQFKQAFAWDLNMLDGYPYRFLKVNQNPRVNRFTGLRLQEPLHNLFREKQVTALWIQGWQVLAYWQAVWQAHAAGIPVWVRGESNDFAQTPLWKNTIKRIALGQLFRRIKYFLYIGSANRRFYESYGISEEQLRPAPYGVDNDRFARQAKQRRPERDAIRRAWNIPEDAFCILFAGKFIPKKRPLDVVAAASHLRHASLGLRLHLLFAGSGELGSALRQGCTIAFDAEGERPSIVTPSSSNGDKPHASFTGFLNQTEISKAYVAADCLVLPSNSQETWGLVVNEAMASGLPCIVSDACGCSEDLVAAINFEFRFPLGDLPSLSSALRSLVHEPPPSQSLGDQVSMFSLSTSIKTVADLYNSGLVRAIV
jgi:glycosyltransferase involved in cell wall biosynthesis